jgi:glycosyltransferase involved in cell wall biosynthesis
LGLLSDGEVTQAYSIADVFVFPSHSESFGISIVEAAAAGLPIASTRVGVAEEIIQEGHNGYTVAAPLAGFAERIVDVLSSEDMRVDAERGEQP